MSRLATSFVLGYHGCEKSVGMAALRREIVLKPSAKGFDWLGRGVYFWEGDPQRAWEWAMWKKGRGEYKEPFVIGTVIDLGNCLDLTARENIDLLPDAYEGVVAEMAKAGKKLPQNVNAPDDPFKDKLLRYLDYAVIEKVHASIEEAAAARVTGVEPFDTVRGLFQEGDRAYPEGGIFAKSHTQIAVRNLKAIKGVFLPDPAYHSTPQVV
ncbi:hypothetical protein [Phenylobacterium sp.]|uniref:hypothetical protein n=1 Tax=Phenylobacterium sp. TaxID=1871053 RepID=UPI00272F4387|nr:hypothetical protein [Phenylobacterium sp.]MDP2214930.1 hypothetical protein [Phenylobacterium sp.]